MLLFHAPLAPGLDEPVVIDCLTFRLLVDLGLGCTRLIQPVSLVSLFVQFGTGYLMYLCPLETHHYFIHLLSQVIHGSVHGDEYPGVDAAIRLIETLAYGNSEEVKTILENVILLVNVVQNPDGRVMGTRRNANNFDVNRDFIAQTQPETHATVKILTEWNPMVTLDLHGFVTPMLIEPCTPPHNPNYEYDLYIQWAYQQALAMDPDEAAILRLAEEGRLGLDDATRRADAVDVGDGERLLGQGRRAAGDGQAERERPERKRRPALGGKAPPGQDQGEGPEDAEEQGRHREAERYYQRIVDEYPQSPYVARARQMTTSAGT